MGYAKNVGKLSSCGWYKIADDIFKIISLSENVLISIEISLKYVPKGPINNIPAPLQIIAWRRRGHKPLSELVMVSLLTHIRVTRPQWVKQSHDRINLNPQVAYYNICPLHINAGSNEKL